MSEECSAVTSHRTALGNASQHTFHPYRFNKSAARNILFPVSHPVLNSAPPCECVGNQGFSKKSGPGQGN